VKQVWEEMQNILAQTPLFQELSAEEREQAVSDLGGRTSSYRKGQLVHTAFSPFREFGLVLSGQVNVCTDDINGNRMIMVTVAPGTTFGESLAYLKTPEPSVYAVALEDTDILWLSVEKLMDPEAEGLLRGLQMRFTSVLAKRTISMNTRIQILSKLTLREKIIALLSSAMTEKTDEGLTVSFRREDMASYLGTNRSALSRELSRMKREGILDYHKNQFHILNEKK